MKLVEICFWNSMYLLIYLALSLYLHNTNNEGTILGTIIIGLIFTAIISIILYFQEGILLEDDGLEIKEISSKEEKEPPVQIKKKHEYKKRKTEVKNNEEKPSQEKMVEFFDGIEPEPKMRTDVNLDKLDDDTDDQPE